MSEPTPIPLENALDAYEAVRRCWAVGRYGAVWLVQRNIDYSKPGDMAADDTAAMRFDKEADARHWLHVQCMKAALKAQREACARIAEAQVSTDADWDNSYWNQCAQMIALKIRSAE